MLGNSKLNLVVANTTLHRLLFNKQWTMKEAALSKEFIIVTVLIVAMFSTVLIFVMYYIRRKSYTELRDRYDSEKKMVELEYMRKNIEMQLYDVSRKLEENESRWRDINHLVISSQNKLEKSNNAKSDVQPNDFLKSLGIDNDKDFEIESRQVFVLTPFNDDYRDTFYLIRDVCDRLNLKCIRGDEEFIPNDIFPVILKQIVKSRLIIANITGRNPNVMYELGVAHAIGKPTIIISKNFTDIPFDLNNKRIIIYEDQGDLFKKLNNSITDLLINKII